jgi:serine/threonine-protein kinase
MADGLGICPECGGTFPGSDRFCQRDGARLLPADGADPLLGQTVGSYRIAALIGAGGMGRVYLGVHPTIGSRVAIKVLSLECASRPELVERFFAEAQLVNRIRHEGIVNVIDLALLPDGRPYIVMELLAGEPLSALIERSGRLEAAHAVALACAMLDALAAAHERGVVHRDLKPDNVFVTRQGRVVVLDFGIAKLLPQSTVGAERISPATRTGAVLGTPGYMAPELIQGRPTVPATDLYAVGVILYQALSGRLPFGGESLFELMHKHVSATPPPLREMRPDIAPALEAVIARAMAKDPAMRFAGAHQMAEALRAALSGNTSDLPTAPWPTPSPRRRAVLAGAGIVGLLAAAGVLVALLAPGDEPGDAVAAVLDAGPAAPAVATSVDDDSKRGESAVDQPVEASEPVEPSESAPAEAAPEREPHVAGGPAKTPRRAVPPRRGDRDRAADDERGPGEDKQEEEKKAAQATPDGAAKSSGSKQTIGGVTIINTAELAREKTGLKTITARPESRGGAFDPMRTLAQAEGMARKLMADAVLVAIDIDHARPDGTALLGDDSGATYRFRSPSHSKRPAGVPRNVEVDIPCMIHVEVVRDRIAASPVTDEECDDARLARPRCKIADLWRRAREQGAPKTGDWVARISYMRDGWFIDIPRAGTPPFEDFTASLPDDCR